MDNGLIDDSSGVKLTQGKYTDPRACFNTAAGRGGPLYDIIMEARRPFWIDRLQGGTYYHEYPFDRGLVEHYAEELGDHFLGFQMHESLSNFITDRERIRGAEHTPQAFIDSVIKAFPDYPGHVMLESQSLEEWLDTPPSDGAEDYLRCVRNLLKKRMALTGGRILLADSYMQAVRLATEEGVRLFMPEIGAQTPFSRIQAALARGAARRIGAPFGVFQEPWGGVPFGTSCCLKDDAGQTLTEWQGNDCLAFRPFGETGGSSTYLLMRIYLFALLSGAEFLGEEWGAANTFYSLKECALTGFGRMKKAFIDFVRHHPGLGKPHIPAAIVLPEEMKIVNFARLNGDWSSPVGKQSVMDDERERKILSLLPCLFSDGEKHDAPRREADAITNGPLGDIFDIVWEDDPNLKDYRALIDLTFKDSFRQAHPLALRAESKEALLAAAVSLQEEIMPVTAHGKISWILNRIPEGYALGLFNNEGVVRTVADGEYTLPDMAADVTVSFHVPHGDPAVIFGRALPSMDEGACRLTVPPGEAVILWIPAHTGA